MLHLGVAHSLIHKNNTHEIYSTLQCFDNMFHMIYAHEWMNKAHVHEMQVQLCKPNTRGVTPSPGPPLVPRLGVLVRTARWRRGVVNGGLGLRVLFL